MSAEAALFLPPQAQVLALPSAGEPRLYLASESAAQRWRHSGLYPAFRRSARAYRVALRVKAALGLGRTWSNPGVAWALGEFVQDCLPGVEAAVVSLGTPGPARKITVQLWAGARVVGYLKYAETSAARARLEQEHRVLGALPAGVGPNVLKYAAFEKGQALVTAPVPGRAVPTRLPPDPGLVGFLETLRQDETFPLERHPWVLNVRQRFGTALDGWLEPLASESWPVVFQHGDFAPWNVLRRADGTLTAIDWEYGSVEGFPHLDAAYYLLQVAALMRRWPPERARAYAARHLGASLAAAQADALVRLAAFAAHQEALADGHDPSAPLQAWRRAVWEDR